MALACAALVPCASAAQAPQQVLEQARMKAKALGGQLSSTLKQAMVNGGPVAGIEVCQQAARPIADGLSDDHWQVGRTSLKLRNPMNQADAWATQTLQTFAQQLQQDGTTNVPEAYKWDDDTQTLVYMKAIVTQPVCTTCHGVNLHDDVQAALREKYPHDLATGFKAGDLRGAFIVTYKGLSE